MLAFLMRLEFVLHGSEPHLLSERWQKHIGWSKNYGGRVYKAIRLKRLNLDYFLFFPVDVRLCSEVFNGCVDTKN